MNNVLEGRRIKLLVSDPWEFYTETGESFLFGTIEKVGYHKDNSLKLLVKIEDPVRFEEVIFEHLIVSSRLEGYELQRLEEGSPIPCNTIKISNEQANSENPFDTSWWRGGPGLIGAILLV